MNDERALLEQRIAWLERKMVRLLWFSISVVSFMAPYFAYNATEQFGGLVAFGCAAAALLIVAFYLHRAEFKGRARTHRIHRPVERTTALHGPWGDLSTH